MTESFMRKGLYDATAIVVDVCPTIAEMLDPGSVSLVCSKCNIKCRDFGSIKAHHFLQHSVLDEAPKVLDLAVAPQTINGTRLAMTFQQEIRYYCPVKTCRFALLPHYPCEKQQLLTGKYFAELRYAREHFLRLHSQNPLKCQKCGLKCRTGNELKRHESACEIFNCPCGKTAKTRCGYLRHVKACHSCASKTETSKDCRSSKTKRTPTGTPGVVGRAPLLLPALNEAAEITSLEESKWAKGTSVLSINSCVQTTESALSRNKRFGISKGAQCFPLHSFAPVTLRKVNQEAQAGEDFDCMVDTKSSAVQTIALTKEPPSSLRIDAFTQTELLDVSEGFTTQDASELLLYLQSDETPDSPCFAMETQTVEEELAPFMFPSTSSETQTFACGNDDIFFNLASEFSTETLGTQTLAPDISLVEEFAQESVDMQTQTLEVLESFIVWDFTDADTQTSTAERTAAYERYGDCDFMNGF